jgi:hypothetical protein
MEWTVQVDQNNHPHLDIYKHQLTSTHTDQEIVKSDWNFPNTSKTNSLKLKSIAPNYGITRRVQFTITSQPISFRNTQKIRYVIKMSESKELKVRP